MPAYDKVGGVLREVSKIYDRVGGVSREVSKGYDKVGGVLREYHSGSETIIYDGKTLPAGSAAYTKGWNSGGSSPEVITFIDIQTNNGISFNCSGRSYDNRNYVYFGYAFPVEGQYSHIRVTFSNYKQTNVVDRGEGRVDSNFGIFAGKEASSADSVSADKNTQFTNVLSTGKYTSGNTTDEILQTGQYTITLPFLQSGGFFTIGVYGFTNSNYLNRVASVSFVATITKVEALNL